MSLLGNPVNRGSPSLGGPMLGALALTYLWVATALRKEDEHMRSRPQTVSAAAILLALFSVLNLVFPLFPIEGIPAAAVYIGVVAGAAGLVGAAGL